MRRLIRPHALLIHQLDIKVPQDACEDELHFCIREPCHKQHVSRLRKVKPVVMIQERGGDENGGKRLLHPDAALRSDRKRSEHIATIAVVDWVAEPA